MIFRQIFFSFCVIGMLAILSACDTNSTLTIEGKLYDSSYNGGHAYLLKRDVLREKPDQVVDSVPIQGHSFRLKTKTGQLAEMLILSVRQPNDSSNDLVSDVPVIIEPGVLTVVYDTFGASLSGTPLNDEYNSAVLVKNREMKSEMEKSSKEREEMDASGLLTTQEMEVLNNRISARHKAYMEEYVKFVDKYKSTALGEFLFFQFPVQVYPEDKRKELWDAMPEETRSRYEARERAKDESARYFQESIRQTSVGLPFRDIVGKTIEGEEVRLSDYAGKGTVILIDFWASWCAPCIQEIPVLKDLKERYKDKDFMIFGVSLDTDRDAWVNAVKKYDTPWIQISDLKGFEGPVAKDYGIRAIPFLILLDKDGTIILRNLRERFLEEALDKAFS